MMYDATYSSMHVLIIKLTIIAPVSTFCSMGNTLQGLYFWQILFKIYPIAKQVLWPLVLNKVNVMNWSNKTSDIRNEIEKELQ